MRRLQKNAVSDMQLIAMMLTTAIKNWMWSNLPVEKSLDWHNTINLQGAGARNKLVTALGLQQYWGALETCLCLCLLACWLPHLGTLELCLRVYLGPLTCWQQYQPKEPAALQVGSPAKSASWLSRTKHMSLSILKCEVLKRAALCGCAGKHMNLLLLNISTSM